METPEYVRVYDVLGRPSVLTTREDAEAAARDLAFTGNVFFRPTDVEYEGEKVYERIDPATVRAADEDDPGLTKGDREMIDAARTGEGLIPATPALLAELAGAARETRAHFDAEFSGMTREQAEFVRRLRCAEDGYSWRAVAATCALEWGGDWGDNQLAGMSICKAAARHFDENFMEPPWN